MLLRPAARFGITTVSTVGAVPACAASATCVESDGFCAAAGSARANSSIAASTPVTIRVTVVAVTFSLRSYMVVSLQLVGAARLAACIRHEQQAVVHDHSIANLERAEHHDRRLHLEVGHEQRLYAFHPEAPPRPPDAGRHA